MQHITDEKKVYDLLSFAREHCPYYSFLPHLKKGTSQSLKEYIQNIPTLSREVVQSQQARILSSSGNRNSWRQVQTSGRSGRPVQIVMSPDARAVDAVLLSMHIDRLLGNADWRQGRTYHLTLHAGSSSRTIRALWHDQGLVTKWNLVRAWQESDQKFCEALAIVQDCVVTMMPSVAELLCARFQKPDANRIPSPLLVILSGEMVSTELKSNVSTTFGCPVFSLYTMAEVGIVGSEHSGESTYQVEDKSAMVEILNEKGEQLPDGQEGEIVITPLNNYAMPLIRYRTGDRAYWVDSNTSPSVFRIVDARKPEFLTTSNGKTVNTVRFAKLLTSLGFNYYNINQDSSGNITFSYTFSYPDQEERITLAKAMIRGYLGPDTKIEVRKSTKPESSNTEGHTNTVGTNHFTAEPLEPDPAILANWLRQRLRDITDIELAVLTGSSLDSGSTTRFSDIDMLVMVRSDPDDFKWIKLERELKSYIPKLSINFDTLKDFSKRAPFLTCRLLSEQTPLIGILDESVLSRPSPESICLNGLYWTQENIAMIYHRTADAVQVSNKDPILESWQTAKWIFNALRYKYVVSGETNTSTKVVLDRLQSDQDIPDHWKARFVQIVNISREIIPPPLFDQNEFENYAKLAISFIRLTQRHLIETLEQQ